MKRPKEEQIEAILSYRGYLDWILSQLKKGEDLEDKNFYDFFDVTYEEIYEYALKHGFGKEILINVDEDKLCNSVKYGIELCWCMNEIEILPKKKLLSFLTRQKGNLAGNSQQKKYEVFLIERGCKQLRQLFDSREEAVGYLVKRLIKFIWHWMSYSYKKKHPEEQKKLKSPISKHFYING